MDIRIWGGGDKWTLQDCILQSFTRWLLIMFCFFSLRKVALVTHMRRRKQRAFYWPTSRWRTWPVCWHSWCVQDGWPTHGLSWEAATLTTNKPPRCSHQLKAWLIHCRFKPNLDRLRLGFEYFLAELHDPIRFGLLNSLR